MKILHINSYYSVSKFYKNLYDRQIKSGLDIDVFVPVSSSFETKNFDYGKYTTISKNHNKYERYLFHLKHYKIYKDVEKRYNIEKYSVIHAHSLFSNGYIAMMLKKQYGNSYIVAVRNTDVNTFFKKMIHLRRMGVQILENADKVIFLSKSYRDKVIEEYVPESLKEEIRNKISIIPNGIDEFWFSNLGFPKQEPKLPKLKLLHIGDINRNKNIEATVKAIKILIENGYKIQFDVVGKVKDKRVFNKIKDLEYVNYLGYRSKEELINIYRANEIFVLPSINETFGLVYPEAMSQGLPIIFTRGQGFDGQFEVGEVGYSGDCFDAKEIAYKIMRIINNYRQISEKCIKSCARFNWESISNSYERIYSAILDKNVKEPRN